MSYPSRSIPDRGIPAYGLPSAVIGWTYSENLAIPKRGYPGGSIPVYAIPEGTAEAAESVERAVIISFRGIIIPIEQDLT